MSAQSTYLKNKLANLMFGLTAFTPPANLYLALFTAAPTDDGGGTEVSGTAYTRLTLANNTTIWPVVTNGEKTLAAAASFPEALSNWGTVVAVALFDASTGGNMLVHNTITPVAINQNDVMRVPAGTAGISIPFN